MDTEKTMVVRTDDFQMVLATALLVKEAHDAGTLGDFQLELLAKALFILINHSAGDLM